MHLSKKSVVLSLGAAFKKMLYCEQKTFKGQYNVFITHSLTQTFRDEVLMTTIKASQSKGKTNITREKQAVKVAT